MIKYLGSKRRLVPHILELVRGLDGVHRVADLFSGTARVGHALKREGYEVWANDHNAYAACLARCYVEADAREWSDEAARRVTELGRLAPAGDGGWFTETYCRQARYFMPANGARIEAVREAIAAAALPPTLEAVLLVALMEAADRVDSTVGLQMAYLKDWAPRASAPLELRVPALLPGPGRATRLDAADAAAAVAAWRPDLVYLDPPYNQHSYLGNYHVWETLVLWDRPEVYGVARKRADVRERKSPYNSRAGIKDALCDLCDRIDARWLLLSFNDEGYIAVDELEELLRARGALERVDVANPRHVGARIGIHDHLGRRVGTPGRLENREHLFLLRR
ncbi:MAG: DNA adenine methylase [Planctomycetota bacterium]